MPTHPLTNSEILCYILCYLRQVYSQNCLPKTKDGAYLIILDEYKSNGTHLVALYMNDNKITYFDNFAVKHILKEIKKIIGNKNNMANINRIPAHDSMCG